MNTRTIVLSALISVSMLALCSSGASAATDIGKYVKKIEKTGAKVLCICTDGTSSDGYGGTVVVGGSGYPGSISLACGIVSFGSEGETSGISYCYTFDTL